MEQMLIPAENYVNKLIDMIYQFDENYNNPFTTFIKLLVKHSNDNGMLIRKEIFPIIRIEMKYNNKYIQRTIDILRERGHIRTIGVTIYLHPKYIAAKNCGPEYGGTGLFVISPK